MVVSRFPSAGQCSAPSPSLCKGRWVCASKAGGVVSCRQTGDVHIFLRLPSTPQSRQSRDSSPCTGEPRRKPSGNSCARRAAQGSRGADSPAAEQQSPRVWFAQMGGHSPTRKSSFPLRRACQAHCLKSRAPLASPVQGEVGLRQQSRRGCFVPPNGGRTYIFASAVNPSVSLTADSSPYTGDPRRKPSGNSCARRAAQRSSRSGQNRTACKLCH